MNTFFSLWDVETGNSLGTYPTETDALAVVRELIAMNGIGIADALELSRCDRAGRCETIAAGSALSGRVEPLPGAEPARTNGVLTDHPAN